MGFNNVVTWVFLPSGVIKHGCLGHAQTSHGGLLREIIETNHGADFPEGEEAMAYFMEKSI